MRGAVWPSFPEQGLPVLLSLEPSPVPACGSMFRSTVFWGLFSATALVVLTLCSIWNVLGAGTGIRGPHFLLKLLSVQPPFLGSTERKIQEGPETHEGSGRLFRTTEASAPRGSAVGSRSGLPAVLCLRKEGRAPFLDRRG